MFSHRPFLNAATANHVQVPMMTRAAAAAPENGRNAERRPIAVAVMNTIAMRDPRGAGAMNRFDRKLSAMLACIWMPAIFPDLSSETGVVNTSFRPDAEARPTNTILSLK